MSTYTRTLSEVNAASLALVGGKGANLGELVAAGAPVPLAFCVTTDAYRSFMEQHELPQRIKELLADGRLLRPGRHRGVAPRRSEPSSWMATIPADIAADIASGYRALEAQLGEGVEVSVRSSATAEDLPGTSFAGQQDTYLCISGLDAVTDAVRRCWASLWTDRAIAYRHTQGFDHDSVLLAVVVQEMFPSEVSGVLFTANPVTSNPFQLFLNASWGLGEAVVSGQVNPDQLIVDKETLAVVDRQINDKQVMTVRARERPGLGPVPVPDEPARASVVDRRPGHPALHGRQGDRGPLRLLPGHRVGHRRRPGRHPPGPGDHRRQPRLRPRAGDVEDPASTRGDVRRAVGVVPGLLRRVPDRPDHAVLLHVHRVRDVGPEDADADAHGDADHARLPAPRAHGHPLLPLVRGPGLLQPRLRARAHPLLHAAVRPDRGDAPARSRRRSARSSGTCRSTGTSSSACCRCSRTPTRRCRSPAPRR